MDRKIYKLTEKQASRVQPFSQENYVSALKAFDVNKEKYGKKFGLMKRDYAASLMTCCTEYVQGCWQGKLDRCAGLDYWEEKNKNKSYNLGYYRGYNENPSGYLRDAKISNPNFADIN